MVREKTGVSKKRIQNDPAFARTRENGSEFGAGAKAGKFLRDAIRPLLGSASDSSSSNRLTKLMIAILKYDDGSLRGDRHVGAGLVNPIAKSMLKGFNFNVNADLRVILRKPFSLDTSSGEVASLGDLIPLNDIMAPPGATHMLITSAFANVDFVNQQWSIFYSQTETITLNSTPVGFTLLPESEPTGDGSKFYFLKLEFRQQINGGDYSLSNGIYNALAIIEVL